MKLDGRKQILPCPQCDHFFNKKDSLKHHIKTIHEGVRYHCDQCNYAATSSGNLNRHKRRRHENRGITNDPHDSEDCMDTDTEKEAQGDREENNYIVPGKENRST